MDQIFIKAKNKYLKLFAFSSLSFFIGFLKAAVMVPSKLCTNDLT